MQGCGVLRSVAEPKQLSLLKATEFEYRHQTLVHQLIIGAAFLTYLVDREDIVWRLVKDTATPHALERLVFIVATMFIAMGVGFCTWGRAHQQPPYLGDFSYAIGLGSLVPVAGFLILVGGEALRVFRLARGIDNRPWNWQSVLPASTSLAGQVGPNWRKAFRQEAAKWGILVAMTVFAITLEDRHVEILALASFLVGILLNGPTLRHATADDPSS